MKIAVVIEGQMNLSYAQQLAAARRAEQVGIDGFFRTDHYESFPGPDDQATTDAWSVLAGLARETSRITLGTLVSPVTFRAPGEYAKVVATVQEMAGRRIHAGLGTGWHESEHRRHGFPFPEMSIRAEMLEEQLEIVRSLWSGPDGWRFDVKRVAAAPPGITGLWLLGDNAERSRDSRHDGPLPLAALRGRVIWRLAPRGRRGAISRGV